MNVRVRRSAPKVLDAEGSHREVINPHRNRILRRGMTTLKQQDSEGIVPSKSHMKELIDHQMITFQRNHTPIRSHSEVLHLKKLHLKGIIPKKVTS